MKPRAMGYFYKVIVQAHTLVWFGNMGGLGCSPLSSLGVFTRESVGTSLGATSGFWRTAHGSFCPPMVDELEDARFI